MSSYLIKADNLIFFSSPSHGLDKYTTFFKLQKKTIIFITNNFVVCLH